MRIGMGVGSEGSRTADAVATRAGWRARAGRWALGAALLAGSSLAVAQTSFSDFYEGGTSVCGTTYEISGMEPTASGTYPVFVYIGGTGEPFEGQWAMAAVEAAAEKGFVAASIEYPNSTFGSCTTIGGRASCIFDEDDPDSAINQLCSRAKADCSKGIVTGGLSQGSIISVLSKNYNDGVRASFGQGTGTYYSGYNLASCMDDGNHAQSGDRLRIINGERDIFVGGTESAARSSAEDVTGLDCFGQQSCFRSNGSGWYIVKDYEVYDLYADHCFMGYGGYYGSQCLGLLVDPGYEYGSDEWQLDATLDWLATFVTP